MHHIFRPATGLMNRLTYPQKFLLISLLFLLPLAVGLTILISLLNTDMAFARKELDGTAYLRPLRTLLAHTIEEQLLAERYFSGETTLEPQVLAQHEQLKADLAALSAVEARLGPRLGTSVQYETLLNQWNRLDAQLLLRSVADNSAAHGRFITTIRDLMNRVGDQSNLILDPSLDTYYLMDTVLLDLPESLDLLAQTAGVAGPIAARRALLEGERNRLTVLYGLVQANSASLDHDLKIAFNEDPTETLRPALSRPTQDFTAAVTTLLASLDSGIIQPAQVQLSPADLRGQVEASLTASFALWDQSIGELDRLLLARELLAESGSIFVQISDENVHHVRELMDEVFGAGNFVASIAYRTAIGMTARTIDQVFDYLVWFAKDKQAVKFRRLFALTTIGGEGATRYKQIESPDGEKRRLMDTEERVCLLYTSDAADE